jgi:hypothetical protein
MSSRVVTQKPNIQLLSNSALVYRPLAFRARRLAEAVSEFLGVTLLRQDYADAYHA